jgi:hypothetical protein
MRPALHDAQAAPEFSPAGETTGANCAAPAPKAQAERARRAGGQLRCDWTPGIAIIQRAQKLNHCCAGFDSPLLLRPAPAIRRRDCVCRIGHAIRVVGDHFADAGKWRRRVAIAGAPAISPSVATAPGFRAARASPTSPCSGASLQSTHSRREAARRRMHDSKARGSSTSRPSAPTSAPRPKSTRCCAASAGGSQMRLTSLPRALRRFGPRVNRARLASGEAAAAGRRSAPRQRCKREIHPLRHSAGVEFRARATR